MRIWYVGSLVHHLKERVGEGLDVRTLGWNCVGGWLGCASRKASRVVGRRPLAGLHELVVRPGSVFEEVIRHEFIRCHVLQLFLGRLVTDFIQDNLVKCVEAGELVLEEVDLGSIPSSREKHHDKALCERVIESIAGNELRNQRRCMYPQCVDVFSREVGRFDGSELCPESLDLVYVCLASNLNKFGEVLSKRTALGAHLQPVFELLVDAVKKICDSVPCRWLCRTDRICRSDPPASFA